MRFTDWLLTNQIARNPDCTSWSYNKDFKKIHKQYSIYVFRNLYRPEHAMTLCVKQIDVTLLGIVTKDKKLFAL